MFLSFNTFCYNNNIYLYRTFHNINLSVCAHYKTHSHVNYYYLVCGQCETAFKTNIRYIMLRCAQFVELDDRRAVAL